MLRHFKKINPKQAIYGSHGQAIMFPDFGNGFGGISTDNPKLIAEFEKAISKNRGGISEVTEKELEDLKKKPPQIPFREEIRPSQVRQSGKNGAGVRQRNAAGADRGDLKMPATGAGLLMPSAVLKPTGFRPNTIPL